jgi:hypothetical protein
MVRASQAFVIGRKCRFDNIRIHTLRLAAMFARAPSPGSVHQNAPHGFRRNGIKVIAILRVKPGSFGKGAARLQGQARWAESVCPGISRVSFAAARRRNSS